MLHLLKGVAGVFGASVALPFLPAAAPVVQTAIWVWFGMLMLGLLRQMRLLRLRSTLWLRVSAALAARTRSDRRAHRT